MKSVRNAAFVTLLVASALLPRLSNAMEIAQFDEMAKEDQRHYLAFLANEAKSVQVATKS